MSDTGTMTDSFISKNINTTIVNTSSNGFQGKTGVAHQKL